MNTLMYVAFYMVVDKYQGRRAIMSPIAMLLQMYSAMF